MTIQVGAAGSIMPPVEAILKTARRNEEKGYDSLWWPDHWMAWHPQSIWTPDVTPLARFQPNPHVYMDPVTCMAAVAVHTERVRLGTAVTEPIRRHPALLAHEWLSLDHLSKGRAILGVGAGEAENNEPYGLSFARPVARLEESLAIIRLLWESADPVDFDGEFWTLRDAVCGLGPHTPEKYPPIWVGANGPRMLDICGRLGDGWMPTQFLPADVYAQRWERVRGAARAAGRDPDAIEASFYALMVVAATHEEAHRLLDDRILKGYLLVFPAEAYESRGYEHPMGRGAHPIRDYVPSRWGREETLKAIDAIPPEIAHECLLHGTPDEIVARVRAYEAAGARHAILWNVGFMGDLSTVRESFHLADDVMRALKAG